jgi:tetratricopeptide (TPR) repeat protein
MHRIFFLVIAACLLLGGAAARAADKDIADCDNVKDWQIRVDGCTRLIERKKWPPKVMAIFFLQRAQGLVNLHQFDSALADVTEGLKYDKTAALYSQRAMDKIELGDYDGTLEDADQALRLDHNNQAAYIVRGWALTAKGEYDQALEAYAKAIVLNPNFAAIYTDRSAVFIARGEWDRAVKDLDTAIKLDPNNAMSYHNRCVAFKNMGELDDALADCNQAIKIDDDSAIAHYHRGGVLFQKGDLDGALSDFNRTIRLDPESWVGYAGRGDVWRKRGDLARAHADFAQAIHIASGATRVYVSEGLVYEAEGDLGHARESYKTAIDLPATMPGTTGQSSIIFTFKPDQDIARARLVVLDNKDVAPTGPLTPLKRTDLTSPQAPVLGRRVALVIGNGRYEHAPQLSNPVNDARLLAQQLRSIGFEVSEGTDLDRKTMTNLIGDFMRAASTASTALLFYAGHGVQVDGRNFLLPIDVTFDDPANFTSEMTDLDTIIAGLDDGLRANVIILDACRNNPMVDSAAQPKVTSRAISVRSGLAAPTDIGKGATAGAGTLLAFATAPGQVALDGEGADSPFSLALARHIGTPGLEVQQMLTRVRAEVVSATHSQQVPWSNSSLLGEVYLAGNP